MFLAQALHNEPLPGKFLLQLDEVVNISAGFKERYNEKFEPRCLKLHLTDGSQRLVALEYQPLPALSINTPAGTKASAQLRAPTIGDD